MISKTLLPLALQSASAVCSATLEADLERVDQEIGNLGVPMQHSQLFFSIKSHVDDVRARLAARLVQTRSQKAKVA